MSNTKTQRSADEILDMIRVRRESKVHELQTHYSSTIDEHKPKIDLIGTVIGLAINKAMDVQSEIGDEVVSLKYIIELILARYDELIARE